MDTVKLVQDTLWTSMTAAIKGVMENSGNNIGMGWSVGFCVFLVITLLVCFFYYNRRKGKYYHDVSRRKKETHIWLQILMLFSALGVFFSVCAIMYHTVSAEWLKWFAGIGVLLTWICQDTVKNVVAYCTLKFNKLIRIGDWVILEKYGIDGEVADMSLSSIVIKNWDNTLSTISIKSLLDTNLQNLQSVSDKKTPGRRMMRRFLIDIHSIRPLSKREFTTIKKALAAEDISAIEYAEKQGEVQNLRVFRLYLQHWLLSQETVTRSPKLAIRLLDTTTEGLPLQIYAFLLTTKWEEFEQEQARIVEHVIDTMHLFGLVFFQYPAGTDTNKIEIKKEKTK